MAGAYPSGGNGELAIDWSGQPPQDYASQRERTLRQLGELNRIGQQESHLDPAYAHEQWRREQIKIISDRERKMAVSSGMIDDLLKTAAAHQYG